MFDQKIIDLYQWIVDTTQKKPGWLGEQVMTFATVINIVSRLLKWDSNWDALFLLMDLTCAVFLISASRSEASFKMFSGAFFIRGFMLGAFTMEIFSLIIKPSPLHALDVAGTIFFGSYYYFSACQNPRPKKRKQKVSVLKTA